jgi:uncharacterized RDD family membrane protein YckC
MTAQPPPPGNYPHPWPSGYPPPPPQGPGYSPPSPREEDNPRYDSPQPAAAELPKEAYTPWFTRVAALVIDYIPILILTAIGAVYFFSSASKDVTACVTDTSEYDLGEFCATGNQGLTGAAIAVLLLTWLIIFAYAIWNYGYRQGKTGSSIGKSIAQFQVVSENTGQPIGFGMSIVRQLAHLVDLAICYIGYLFPLWDPKRQTLADKIMSTVCVPLAPQPPPPGPLAAR